MIKLLEHLLFMTKKTNCVKNFFCYNEKSNIQITTTTNSNFAVTD
jgi:hypothetical protein